MKCKEIQQWLIDLSEGLEEDRLSQIEEHVAQCAKCARFEEELKKIRLVIKKTKTPAPSEDVFRRTQLMCHAAIKMSRSAESGFLGRIKAASIPAYIWLVFALLIVLTVIVILPFLKEWASDEPLSLQAVVTLSLMIQNAVMLFLSPILIRKYRMKNQDFNPIETGRSA